MRPPRRGSLTREDVPDYVLRAYGVDSMKFGREYIIPKPLDLRVMLWESTAVAKAAMETGVARKPIDIDEYRQQLALRQGKGARVRQFFTNKAKTASPKKRIVFAEGEETKIIRAARPGAGRWHCQPHPDRTPGSDQEDRFRSVHQARLPDH